MNDRDGFDSTTGTGTGQAAAARLDRLVAQARAASLWEQAWPVLWRGLGVGLLFLALSWAGLWLDLDPLWRQIGLAILALLLIVALLPLAHLARPDRRVALARLDREAATRDPALRHGPASAAQDTLAVGAADPGSRTLWALHQRRAAQAVAALRVGLPRPGMTRRDPYALRAGIVVAAVASLFVAGPEWRARVAAAFDWHEPVAQGPNFRVDGWIDPPLYTRLPPLLIAMDGSDQHLRAPINAQLIVRIAGQGKAATNTTLTPNAGLTPIPSQEERPDLREERYRIVGGAELVIVTPAGRQKLTVDAIPDRPPEVTAVGGPEVNGRGTFNLTYRAKDDYGISSAEGVIEPLRAGRSLAPVPRINLALPADASGETDTKTLVDLTDSPWSGARVRYQIVVKDEAGQEGRTASAEITLPARQFRDPLARALAEDRLRLVTAPDADRLWVQGALDALLVAPDMFTPQPPVFLGLRTATERLRRAKSDADLIEVADLLWEMALKIEDGDLSDAEKQLRQAQDRLKEAIERNAPDDEIKRLTQDLKQALDKFLSQMAQKQSRQPRDPGEKSQNNQQSKTVTPEDLDKMIQDMAEAMKRGDTAEAQRLMEQLRNILENLQTAEKGGQSDQASREMQKQMRDLDAMAREQQGLRDETFKDGQEPGNGQQRPSNRGQPQQGQGKQSPGQQGQQGQQGQGKQGQKQGQGDQGNVGDRQQALRQRLEDLEQRMKENGMRGEQGLSDAEDAMREAENALKQGDADEAVDAQSRALEGLKKGAEGMAQQMQEMAEGQGEGQQEGGQQPGQQGQAGARDDDPLGRPTKGRDMSDGRVRVPTADESAVQRTRRIMEELRRKLGDPTRPREELDYFERLLRRN
ncbi:MULTISPECIES: TIGR02302 family protein [unclassified Methylobacterium]|uniref:TIGR02302 family protein n=1 Tax=unclassified Methylobacterium TaxID=2615210 RepID=UPI0011C1E488|nr:MULTISPECIES: TIGR02302 family protein [unclassified Methylobacterium]QEE40185.1 TIGR02302 family protein [Methylobacterium sp. WL1]TXN58523.1 TIGR02302 family protein [Methylobacterium sp. WL2]